MNEICRDYDSLGKCIKMEETLNYKRRKRANMDRSFENIGKSITVYMEGLSDTSYLSGKMKMSPTIREVVA